MIFRWLRRRRRAKLLATPVPERWRSLLFSLPHIELLPPADRERVLESSRIFIAEKTWEGCGGLQLTEDIQVAIAGFACLMTLGMPEFHYDHVHTVLVYPREFVVPERVAMGPDVALEDQSERLGEAHHRGPVILSWADIQEDIEHPFGGMNLVFHEFAHQLDMTNGAFDGVPLLPSELRRPWADVMAKEFKKLRKSKRGGRRSVIDPYGAEEPAEFFAVVAEAFFDVPLELERRHPQLYDLFRRYCRVDPARWHDHNRNEPA